MADQAEIHRMARSEDVGERREAVNELNKNFAIIKDKEQAWDDLIWLMQDNIDSVRWVAANALGFCYSQIPEENKKQAWDDLHRLTQNNNDEVRRSAANALGSFYSQIPEENKKQAWDDLHRLTQDNIRSVRWVAVNALGFCYSQIPEENKKQAWNDLHKLTQDNNKDVRVFANHSSGRISIYRASEAKSDESVRKELETALRFFEKASNGSTESTFSNPAKFCLPFYRSFYTITFRKEDAEAEVKKYLAEAKSAVSGSKSKEKLLEAVEHLRNALKEAQKARDLDAIKSDLNTYRRYCDRACELLDATEEKAPGASRLIRRGLPIIDERIRGMLAEIEESTTALCKQTKGTQLDNFGREIYWQGHNLSQIGDPIKLENLNKINDERYVENKVEMMDSVMRRILIKVKGMKKIDVKINGNDNKINIDSIDNSINIKGDLKTDLETLSALIERDYKQDDRNEVLQTVNQMKQSCNDSSKKSWIKQKLGWIISRTSEVASISSFAITLLQNVK
ncbi:MAG: HEAT repeat domain-containing protein [Candidatus Methanoperedens sp.]